mgnify:CR=1 FL=1
MIEGKPVVYFKESTNRNGCGFYRIYQPAVKLSERGSVMACPSSELKTIEDKELWFERADLIVTQITSDIQLEMMITEKAKGKGRWVIDWDDNVFNVSPYNPAYKDHGIKEVEVTLGGEKKTLWEDGRDGFSIKSNKERLIIFTECLRNADLVTTPSPILSGMFKKINPNVKVLRNFLDLNVWKPLPTQKDDKIRIGWQGGDSHFEDWCLISDALGGILRANKNVILVMMGTHFTGTTKNFPQDQIQVESWVPIDAYPYKFRSLNLDIGIAPLCNNAFNTAKSELKWTEYGALGIPCVMSNVPPYSLRVMDMDTGFLCSTDQEWSGTIQRLIDDKELRIKVGQNALEEVRTSYDIDKEIVQYEDTYRSLCGLKRELILN